MKTASKHLINQSSLQKDNIKFQPFGILSRKHILDKKIKLPEQLNKYASLIISQAERILQ